MAACWHKLRRSMDEPLTVIVGHRLGKAEARRRLDEGLARSSGQIGPMIRIDQGQWEGDRLRVRLSALGQFALATIEVMEDSLRIDVALPWLLAKAAKHLLPAMRKQTELLLEKK